MVSFKQIVVSLDSVPVGIGSTNTVIVSKELQPLEEVAITLKSLVAVGVTSVESLFGVATNPFWNQVKLVDKLLATNSVFPPAQILSLGGVDSYWRCCFSSY